MKYLKKFEGFSNSEDLSEDIVYSLLDLFDEYNVEEITDDSYDNYLKSNHPRQSTNLAFKSDSFIYTSIIKDSNEIGQWESPKRFHRSGYKNGINYLIIYSNGHPGSQFQEVIEKSIERLNKIYDVKLVRNNENSVTQILDKTTLEIKKLIPCRTWVIEIYEKSQHEGFSNRTCDRCGKQTNKMSMSWLNTDECCMDCLEAEKDEPDYILAKQKEAEQVRKGNLNYGGWRNEE